MAIPVSGWFLEYIKPFVRLHMDIGKNWMLVIVTTDLVDSDDSLEVIRLMRFSMIGSLANGTCWKSILRVSSPQVNMPRAEVGIEGAAINFVGSQSWGPQVTHPDVSWIGS